MQFMLLIYGDEALWAKMPPAQVAEAMGQFRAYTDALKKAGKYVAGSQLQGEAAAKSVTLAGGKRVIDGPYVDTKEALGGYYLIEAENQADALDWAAKCPGAQFGGIEVRPIVNMA